MQYKYSFEITLDEPDQCGRDHILFCQGNSLNNCITNAEYFEVNEDGDQFEECSLNEMRNDYQLRYAKIIKKEFYKRYGKPSRLPKWF